MTRDEMLAVIDGPSPMPGASWNALRTGIVLQSAELERLRAEVERLHISNDSAQTILRGIEKALGEEYEKAERERREAQCYGWLGHFESAIQALRDEIRDLETEVERLTREREDARHQAYSNGNAYSIASDCRKLRDADEPDCGWCQRCLRARVAALEEALTPSGSTKVAYMCKVKALSGEYFAWTEVKDVMALIRKRALAQPAPAAPEQGPETGGQP